MPPREWRIVVDESRRCAATCRDADRGCERHQRVRFTKDGALAMGDKTGISWTDSTWGPVRGCSRISPGCQNCYAERIAGRFSGPGKPFEGFVTLRRRHPPSELGSDGVRHPQTGTTVNGIRAQWNG